MHHNMIVLLTYSLLICRLLLKPYNLKILFSTSDRFLGHPLSVDTLLKVNNDIYIYSSVKSTKHLLSILTYSYFLAWWRHLDFWIWGWSDQVFRWTLTLILLPINFQFQIQIPKFPCRLKLNVLNRLVGILPNRIIQPLAEHSEYPIERLGMHSTIFYILWSK